MTICIRKICINSLLIPKQKWTVEKSTVFFLFSVNNSFMAKYSGFSLTAHKEIEEKLRLIEISTINIISFCRLL